MQYVLYIITALYAVLSSIAAIAQMRTSKEKTTSFIMLGGGIVLIAAAILHFLSVPFSWAAAIAGGLLICLAALINGKKSGSFHILHHIIRFIVTLLLIIGYIIF